MTPPQGRAGVTVTPASVGIDPIPDQPGFGDATTRTGGRRTTAHRTPAGRRRAALACACPKGRPPWHHRHSIVAASVPTGITLRTAPAR